MGKCLTIFVIFLLVLGGGFLLNNIDNTHASIENAHIIKEKVTELTNDGTNKYNVFHLIFDYHISPDTESVVVKVDSYGKNNKYLGEKYYQIYGPWGNEDLKLPNYAGGIKKVEITLLPCNTKLIHPKSVLCNFSTSKIKKNKTTIDNTYEVATPSYDYSSSNDEEDEYYSSYDSYYSSSYDDYSSYSSDDYGSSYDSEPVTGGSYVASSNSDKFHTSSCGHGERIKDSNRIYFSSREEALDSGYEPCAHCNP